MNYNSTLKLFIKGYGRYKFRLAFLILPGLASGLLEGIGITALIPIFSLLTGSGEAGDIISRSIGVLFAWFGVELRIRSLLVFMVFAFVLKAAVLITSKYISVKIASDYEEETRNFLLKNALNANWKFLVKQKVGYLQTILLGDVSGSKKLFRSIATLFISAGTLSIYAIIAFTISPQVTLLALALGGGIFLALKPFFYKARELSRKSAYASAESSHHINQNIIGLKVVKASSIENYVSQKAEKYFKLFRDVSIKLSLFQGISAAVLEPISIIFVMGVFVFSYTTGNFQIGVFAATMYLIHRIFTNIKSLQAVFYGMNSSFPRLVRMIDFQDEVMSNKEVYGATKPFSFQESIEFQGVSFSYENREKRILSDFSLRVKRGEMIGIIGESGAGKTTTVDLLLRLLEPQEGKILVDGTDIRDVDIKDWRKNIGYVPQDIFVVNDTIGNNIRFYNEKVSDEDIVNAAKKAQIYDFIQKQPDQFRMEVGERGALLSGGEKQRLVLARQLARNPSILILDEATSSLDNKSELLIKKAIEKLRGQVTIFVIAHRLSTILNCDKLIFLEGGKISEEGSPEELLENKGSYFYKLYNIRNNSR